MAIDDKCILIDIFSFYIIGKSIKFHVKKGLKAAVYGQFFPSHFFPGHFISDVSSPTHFFPGYLLSGHFFS
jgi:hypothetical protein